MTTDPKDMTNRIEAWIAAGRNPGTAHWHGALEATMASFEPHLQPGCLTPMQPLGKSDYPLFEEVYACSKVDHWVMKGIDVHSPAYELI